MAALEHLAMIWIGVFVAAYLAQKTRLTPVLYYIAVGSFLVNTGLLHIEDDEFIRGFAEIGIILIMFALGFEENVTRFLGSVKRSWGIAFFGALAPFIAAFSVVYGFWGDFNMALISALAMTATAVSLTMVSLKSEGLHNTEAATGIMTSAILDDIASLALVAIVVPIAAGGSVPTLMEISWIVSKAFIFFGIIMVLALWVLPNELDVLWKRLRAFDQWGVKNLVTFEGGHHAVLAVLLLALLVGLLAHSFGFHPAVGAYMAGLILKAEYFRKTAEEPADAAFEDVRRIVDNVAYSWIGPVFFVALGAKIIIDLELFARILPQTILLVVAMFVAQVSSASIAARFTGRFPWRDSVMIGFGMLGRAELAFVVLDIAYVQQQIITDEVFYTLMLTAFWLNIAVPITIAAWKPYYKGEKQLGFLTR